MSISRTFFQDGNVIGGRIDEDAEVNYRSLTIIVSRTIYIPVGVTVVISGGGNFTFERSTGIVVEGERICSLSGLAHTRDCVYFMATGF